MEKIRLFVSIELPIIVRDALVQLQKEIKDSNSVQGTYVHEDKLHITLAFMGHANSGRVPEIIEALKSATFTSFLIDLPYLELVPSPDNPELIWVRARSSDLDELSVHLYDLLQPYGVDDQEFIGHVTLVRIREVTSLEALKTCINSHNALSLTFRAEHMALNKSEPTDNGAPYAKIAEFKTVEELVEEF